MPITKIKNGATIECDLCTKQAYQVDVPGHPVVKANPTIKIYKCEKCGGDDRPGYFYHCIDCNCYLNDWWPELEDHWNHVYCCDCHGLAKPRCQNCFFDSCTESEEDSDEWFCNDLAPQAKNDILKKRKFGRLESVMNILKKLSEQPETKHKKPLLLRIGMKESPVPIVNPIEGVQLTFSGKDIFFVAGDTYPIKDFLKKEYKARWQPSTKQWYFPDETASFRSPEQLVDKVKQEYDGPVSWKPLPELMCDEPECMTYCIKCPYGQDPEDDFHCIKCHEWYTKWKGYMCLQCEKGWYCAFCHNDFSDYDDTVAEYISDEERREEFVLEDTKTYSVDENYICSKCTDKLKERLVKWKAEN